MSRIPQACVVRQRRLPAHELVQILCRKDLLTGVLRECLRRLDADAVATRPIRISQHSCRVRAHDERVCARKGEVRRQGCRLVNIVPANEFE
jgi:hypothetical protein